MTRILAQLSVRRGRAAIEFYEAAFGAVADYRVGGTDEHDAVVAQLSGDRQAAARLAAGMSGGQRGLSEARGADCCWLAASVARSSASRGASVTTSSHACAIGAFSARASAKQRHVPSARRRLGWELLGWESRGRGRLGWEAWDSSGQELRGTGSPLVAAISGASQRRQFVEIAASSRRPAVTAHRPAVTAHRPAVTTHRPAVTTHRPAVMLK
ncbi:MAG TPA: hypothetical protein VK756_05510 [Solirubrobacteraceae bacterium]|nr:hypothetical protein [Solirubrobacteraceae bacterium]